MSRVRMLNLPDGPELDPALAAWVAERVGAPGPFISTPMSGGNSNETAMLTGATGRWVLRRPPTASISRTANDLGREYRVLTALAGQPVPTPRALGYTADPEVSPVACLLMEHVPGAALTDTWPLGWGISAGERKAGEVVGEAGRAAVTALAALHAVDWEAAGLTGFGRPAGYLVRQVSRWRAQYEQNQVRDLPLFEQVGAWLEGNRPAETAPSIIHGDYHLDNCLFVREPGALGVTLTAVIDWELSTIGDPLVDLGLLLAFWGADRPDRPAMPRVQALSRSAGSPSRRELADQYAALSGRSTEELPFYMALAFFKLAAIVEGAYARFLTGQVDSDYARALAEDVPLLLAEAARFAEID